MVVYVHDSIEGEKMMLPSRERKLGDEGFEKARRIWSMCRGEMVGEGGGLLIGQGRTQLHMVFQPQHHCILIVQLNT